MDDELLERFRQIGLRLDREGRFWHQGEPVTHAGVAAALHRMIDRLEDGRTIVRLDAERYAYLEVEDAPYQVRSVGLERGAEGPLLFLLLSDGTEEELRYGSLRVGEADALYCEVKDGRFEARFSRPASRQLGELIEADEQRAEASDEFRAPSSPRTKFCAPSSPRTKFEPPSERSDQEQPGAHFYLRAAGGRWPIRER